MWINSARSLLAEFTCKSPSSVMFPMTENPMFEFMGASGYEEKHRSYKVDSDFEEFKGHHSRQYDSEGEEAKRKTHFRHNHRCVDHCGMILVQLLHVPPPTHTIPSVGTSTLWIVVTSPTSWGWTTWLTWLTGRYLVWGATDTPPTPLGAHSTSPPSVTSHSTTTGDSEVHLLNTWRACNHCLIVLFYWLRVPRLPPSRSGDPGQGPGYLWQLLEFWDHRYTGGILLH